MTNSESLSPAFASLDDGDDAVRKLDAGCCDPGRSPRMAALAETLAAARRELDRMAGDEAAAESALAHLEDAGAQVGGLQVGCCTPKRMPLYARILEDLTAAQLAINQALNRGH